VKTYLLKTIPASKSMLAISWFGISAMLVVGDCISDLDSDFGSLDDDLDFDIGFSALLLLFFFFSDIIIQVKLHYNTIILSISTLGLQ
jgi:hypothetical protein